MDASALGDLLKAAAVVAGMLTVLFNLTKIIVSKEEKVSDFRQSWVDGLREDLSKMLASVETLKRLGEAVAMGMAPAERKSSSVEFDAETLEKFRTSHKDEYRCVEETSARIMLRLNPQEHKELCSAIANLKRIFYGETVVVARLEEALEDVVRESQNVIKAVWERVKSGEKIFQCVRAVIIIIFFAVAGYLIYIVRSGWIAGPGG